MTARRPIHFSPHFFLRTNFYVIALTLVALYQTKFQAQIDSFVQTYFNKWQYNDTNCFLTDRNNKVQEIFFSSIIINRMYLH